MRGKSYLLGSTLIAALGGLLFGFDTAVISGTTTALKKVYDLSDFGVGFAVASALIGTIMGSILVGRPADQIGRRRTLIVIGVLYFVSAVGTAYAWDWYSFLFFRWLGGLGVGGASVVSPMYIAEISPAAYRGRLVAVTQFNIVLGILLAFFSNYLVAKLRTGCHGVAVDVWHGGISGRGVHRAAVLHAVQPALAGVAGTSRRSARRIAAVGE